MFSWSNQPRPMLCLAPMEGYTDSSYRQLIKSVAPSVICCTEFTSADGLRYGSRKSFQKIEFNEVERPLIAQIFGSSPEKMAESAKILTDMGVDGIDINMGCPTGKVVNACQGSALLRHPELATEIVYQVQKATNLEVSIKLRIGYDCFTLESLLNFVKGLEKAGAKHFALHGRTTKQKYSGLADWNPIYEVKKHLKVSVVGNGDIKSVEDVKQKIQNLDGVMIGRGTYGNPWIMAEIENYFAGKPYTPPQSFEEKIPVILYQCKLACEFKGEKVGMLEMRKHLAHYVHGLHNATAFRMRLIKVDTITEAKQILSEIAEEQHKAMASQSL